MTLAKTPAHCSWRWTIVRSTAGSVSAVVGSIVVITQRLSRRTTVRRAASPTCSVRPSHASSANGSSFTGTIVQTQQVASSRMRAIESGRWVLQVAPTGFSAIVDANGRVLERSAVSERRVLQREVALREGQTIYTRVGNAPGLALAALCIAAGWAIQRRSRRED